MTPAGTSTICTIYLVLQHSSYKCSPGRAAVTVSSKHRKCGNKTFFLYFAFKLSKEKSTPIKMGQKIDGARKVGITLHLELRRNQRCESMWFSFSVLFSSRMKTSLIRVWSAELYSFTHVKQFYAVIQCLPTFGVLFIRSHRKLNSSSFTSFTFTSRGVCGSGGRAGYPPSRRFNPSFPQFPCQSALGQDTEPIMAPDERRE